MQNGSSLIFRRDATSRTLSRFRGAEFDWSQMTCVHLAHAHLSEMGHVLPEIPAFDTAISARAALQNRGWTSVADMLDDFVERISPSRMIVGDLALIEGAGGLDAIFICAGPLKVFGWREDQRGLVLLDVSLDRLQGAWRV